MLSPHLAEFFLLPQPPFEPVPIGERIQQLREEVEQIDKELHESLGKLREARRLLRCDKGD